MKYRKIVSIGDSHSQILAGVSSGRTSRVYLGPTTLYQFASSKREQMIFDVPNLFKDDNFIGEDINDESVLIIYCLGEIDIRCNWEKQINEYKADENKFIENLVNEAFVTALSIRKPFGFISIPPAVDKQHIIETDATKEYPVRGSNEDRVRWVKKLNFYLEKKCLENNCVFLNIWEYYADENGLLIHELSDGNVHIKEGKYVREEIDKLFVD